MRARVILWSSGVLLLAGLIPSAAFGAARAYVVADWSPVAVQTPRAAIAADLDGDGQADVATADRAHGKLQVLLAGSGGELTTKGSYAAGDVPHAIAKGDFDRDGHTDLAVADLTGGDVTVLLNDGSGELTAQPTIDVAPEPTDPKAPQGAKIASADLDGDGDRDLVVVNTQQATVLRNDAGAFSVAHAYDGSFMPTALAVADLNGDGHADVAASDDANRFNILLNDGDGGLAPAAVGSPVAAGNGLSDVAAGDVDGDGDIDLATIHSRDGAAGVLLNDGSAGFTRPADRIVTVGGDLATVDIADLDDDGDLDLATASYGGVPGGDAAVLRNDGTGVFAASKARPRIDPTPATIMLADLDGDGARDIAVVGYGVGVVNVLLSRADSDADEIADELDNCPSAANFAQLDSDGDGTGNACDATPMPSVIETTQLAGAAGCVMVAPAGSGCAEGRNLSNAWGLAMSPDGRNVYSTSYHGVAIFDRDITTGALTQKSGSAGCIVDPAIPNGAPAGCAAGHGLAAGEDIDISPDGETVYVTSRGLNSVAILDRDPNTGELSQDPGAGGCLSTRGEHGCRAATGVGGASDVTVSPDGDSVYVASIGETIDGDHAAIAVFDRGDSGDLTQKAGSAGCIWEMAYHDDTCGQARGLIRPSSVVVSPDGERVYVASLAFGAVAVLDRDAGGALSQRGGESACISEVGFLPHEPDEPRECRDGHGIDYPLGLAVSPDGRQLYVSGYGLATLDIESDGSLTQSRSRSSCTTWLGSFDCMVGRLVGGLYRIAISPDGRRVYAGASSENALAVFTRNADTGALVQQLGLGGCIAEQDTDGQCQTGRALRQPGTGIAVSPDGAHIYLTSAGVATIIPPDQVTFSESAVAAFVRRIERPPTAIALSNRTVAENSAPGTEVGTLTTTDPDAGDTHSYALASGGGDADNGAFEISGATLKLATSPDFESQARYSIRIRTTDSTGRSFEQAFEIDVTDVGEGPSIAIGAFGSCPDDTKPVGTVPFSVADPDAGETLTVTATSSNTTLVPLKGIVLSGTGGARTVKISAAAKKSGTAIVTLTVTDSEAARASVAITVMVGGAGNDTLTGTDGADLVFGLGGDNVIDGSAGNDVLCGGNGNDRISGGAGADALLGGRGVDQLTGGAGGDRFSGGPGTDVNVDFDASAGDVTDRS